MSHYFLQKHRLRHQIKLPLSEMDLLQGQNVRLGGSFEWPE